MMFQSKYKHFNKNIKMLVLLLILMWSLMEQHIYCKSPTYAIGIVTVTGAVVKDYIYDVNDVVKVIQENITEITMTKYIQETSSTIKATTITGNMENKVKSKKATVATIYGHINENDNNSNKLPQNVVKNEQQQPNMMYENIKKPAPLQSTSSSSSSSSTTTTTTTSIMLAATRTIRTTLPPTESLLMPKDQLNKTECSEIPNGGKKEKQNKNQTENIKERKTLKVKFNGTRASKLIQNTYSNNNGNNKHRKIYNDLNNDINNETTKSTNHQYERKISFPTDRAKDEKNNRNNIDPKRSVDSIADLQQKLILQFALRFKQIPRVTYFTCQAASLVNKEKLNKNNKNIYEHHMNMKMQTMEFVRRMFMPVATDEQGLMMKVVLIDDLLNKGNARNNETISGTIFDRSEEGGRGPTVRETLVNDNWLEKILRPEPLRQIVVLNLACGASSRRLLEMASNKTFFNSMYHWLLLEDYVFNRQTEIDDVNDIESKRHSQTYNKKEAAKSFKMEIVNDSNITNLQVKKLSAYQTDVIGATTSVSSNRSNELYIVDSTNTASTTSSTYKIPIKNRQQQHLADDKSSPSLNANRAGITDEDDIEIIEKFLQKLNININTELILAKRYMRTIIPSTNSSTTATDNMLRVPSSSLPSPSPPSPTTTTNSTLSTDSNDYNTLSKMNYYLLYDVWNPGLQYGGVLNVSEIGYFNQSEGLKLNDRYVNTSSIRRRLNMQLARIRCLVVVTHKNDSDTLENYLTSHYDPHLDSMNRFNYALLTYVRDLFNFSFILSETSTWGYLKNGKFDGMIGALVQKEADIGGSPIFSRIERAKVIDYTARTWVARPCFIFRHPRSNIINDRIIFLQPFSNDIWILLSICGFIIIIFLWFLKAIEFRLDPEKWKNNGKLELKMKVINLAALLGRLYIRNPKSRGRISFFFDSLLFYIGAICQQGLSFSTIFFSGRCIVITSLLFSFAIYQFYSASIVGTLLMEKPKTIRTLSDLIHSSLEIGIEDIVYNHDYFLRTKDPDARELYLKKVKGVPTENNSFKNFTSPRQTTQMINNAQQLKLHQDIQETVTHAKNNKDSNWYDPEYGVAKIKEGHFAFHVDVATAYKIIADTFTEREICDLSEIELFPPQKMISIVQKGSPLRKVITYGLRRVSEVGLMDYQRKVWHSPKPRCVKQLHADDLRVDMQTFTSALLVLIFGYAVSLLILSLEIVHFKLWQRYMTLTT